MKAEFKYADPKPLPVEGVTLHLSKHEAVDLLALARSKGVWSLTRDVGFETFDISAYTPYVNRFVHQTYL